MKTVSVGMHPHECLRVAELIRHAASTCSGHCHDVTHTSSGATGENGIGQMTPVQTMSFEHPNRMPNNMFVSNWEEDEEGIDVKDMDDYTEQVRVQVLCTHKRAGSHCCRDWRSATTGGNDREESVGRVRARSRRIHTIAPRCIQ